MPKAPLKKIITEKEFLPIVEQASVNFFKVINCLKKDSPGSKTFYANLFNEADLFEDFLDNHGARENKSWFYFTELVASIRNFAIAGLQLRHILDRFYHYKLEDSKEDASKFHREANSAMNFINNSVLDLFGIQKKEATKNGMKHPKECYIDRAFSKIHISRRLPKNLHEDDLKDNEERIIALSRRFRNVAKLSKETNLERFYKKEAEIPVIPKIIDETKVQNFKNILQGIQSDYDTYIKNTFLEKNDKNLIKLRGFTSISLHLLEIVRWLSHFFERHADEVRTGGIKEKFTQIVDRKEGLNTIINFAFFYSNDYLQKGKLVAEKILSKYTIKARYKLSPPKPLGFHARPSGYISLIVKEHGTDVFLVVDRKKFNARSVLSLMEAGGLIADKGYNKVVFEGDKRALDDIKILAEHNYCEDCEIPRELNYVRILRNK